MVTLCFIAFTLLIWNGYQDRQSALATFYFGLPVWFPDGACTDTLLSAHTVGDDDVLHQPLPVRNFAASILEVIIPYWFAAGFFVYTNNIDTYRSYFASSI